MYAFKLPDLGEGIQEGELLEWHVAEGDAIQEDDPLCDMETDKAAVTIPSPKTGTVHRLGARVGDMVQVGHVLVEIETEEDGDQSGTETADDSDGSLSPDQPADEGKSGNTDSDSADSGRHDKQTGAGHKSTDATGPVSRAIAAPAVRRLAREMDIDINQVSGTGPGGRVTAEDLAGYDQAHGKESDKASHKTPEPSSTPDGTMQVSGIPFLESEPLPDFAAQGPVKKIPIRSLRRKTAAKTVTASILVPHVAHMDEADVTELEQLRQTYNDHPKRHLTIGKEENVDSEGLEIQAKPDRSKDSDGQKTTDRDFEGSPDKTLHLTLLTFVIKAVSRLLRTYPAFNASVDTDQMEIIHKQFYHIGFAADTPKGLMVPVIKDADRLSSAALGYRIRYLARAAREGTISREDLIGGTFSVTNVGAIGGTHVVPVINYPESAILGLGRVEKKPVVKADEIVIRQILPMTLCFDHRVADGAQAARFMKDLKAMLEDPVVFLAHT
jgi:pyruvate dehydrogenase E2 component (dihydrolipoamide acetyltransferase)